MYRSTARKLETFEAQGLSPIPAEVIPLRPSIRERKKVEARRAFPREKIEEVGGVVFMIAAFLLAGWFYYNLYQALHN